MERSFRKVLYSLFYSLVALVFAMIFIIAVTGQQGRMWVLLSGIVLGLGLLALIYRGLQGVKEAADRYYDRILLLVLGIMLLFQLALGSFLRYQPIFDLQAIYGGAIEWVETGTFAGQYEYMSYFPNNLGGMAFLSLFFKGAALLGIQDYFLVAMILNSILSLITMAGVSAICKDLFSAVEGIFSLILFALSLPFYFIAPVFYTDSLSMAFPVLILLLTLKVVKAESRREKMLLYGGIGILTAVGASIKFTVVIGVIAALIQLLFQKGLRETFLWGGILLAVAGGGLMGFRGYIYSQHINPERAWEYHTPYTHWVMMGLKGYGGYNPEDYEFTRSIRPELRDERVREELIRRWRKLGITGTLELWKNKTRVDFQDGTYGLSDFLDDGPQKYNVLHEYITYGGTHYEEYQTVTSAVLYCCYLFVAAGALCLLRAPEKEQIRLLAPFAAVFGCWLFLMLWESSGRYFTNYVPVIFICTVAGMRLSARHLQKTKERNRRTPHREDVRSRCGVGPLP